MPLIERRNNPPFKLNKPWTEYNRGKSEIESGFYWIYEVYYYGVVIGYYDARVERWEVWRTDGSKGSCIYRQADIFVTHYKEIEAPPQPSIEDAQRIFDEWNYGNGRN